MDLKKEEREVLPFFIIVVAVMCFLYGMSMYKNTELRTFPGVVLFTILMAIHAVLHWFFSRFATNRRRLFLYFCIQTVFVLAILLYTREITLVFGLFLPLVGEEAGIFRGKRSLFIIIFVNLIQMTAVYLFVFREINIDRVFIVGIIPMILFVIIYVDLYSRQAEARLKAQDLLSELETANTKLRESNLRIERLTIEEERQRMARELHDTLAQGLSGLTLQLEAARVYLSDKNTEKADEIIEKALSKARETLADAREAIDGLRKKTADEGFNAYLGKQAALFADRPDIDYRLATGEELFLTKNQRTEIEKIVSELLLNCLKHSNASRVDVSLERSKDNIVLTVADDGTGFDPEKTAPGHYGLRGVRERCDQLDGSLRIRSSADEGTVASVILPLIDDGDSDDE